jgi:hypothetical protein
MAFGIVALSTATGLAGRGGLGISLFAVRLRRGRRVPLRGDGTAERLGGQPLFQTMHAAFPVAVISATPLTGLVVGQLLEPRDRLLEPLGRLRDGTDRDPLALDGST